MEQIIYNLINQYGLFALLLIIITFCAWAEMKHRPFIERQTAILNARERSGRLILDIRSQQSLDNLKAMIYEIKAITELNTRVMDEEEAKKYNNRIWKDYEGQKTYLFNVEHLGLPQSLMPLLLN